MLLADFRFAFSNLPYQFFASVSEAQLRLCVKIAMARSVEAENIPVVSGRLVSSIEFHVEHSLRICTGSGRYSRICRELTSRKFLN